LPTNVARDAVPVARFVRPTPARDNGKTVLLYVPAGTPTEKLPRREWHDEWRYGGEVQEQDLRLEDAKLHQAKLSIEKQGYFYLPET